MDNRFSRSNELVGFDVYEKLKEKKVVVVGLGGVGGFVTEALARSGIGKLTLIDKDIIDITNINRQIYALSSTVDEKKADIAGRRCLDINPNLDIDIHCKCLNKDNISSLIGKDVSYVVDAIDMVSSKLDLIEYCVNNNIKIISSMGMGNKFNPEAVMISDLYKTKNCSLAKVIRRETRKRGIKKLKVAYSEEIPKLRQQRPASIIFVPSIAGILIAKEVIYDLLELN